MLSLTYLLTSPSLPKGSSSHKKRHERSDRVMYRKVIRGGKVEKEDYGNMATMIVHGQAGGYQSASDK